MAISNTKLAVAALSGLLSSTFIVADNANAEHHESPKDAEKSTTGAEKHACKGQNACKGLGADGKNECKGHGSCATKEKHACKGLNSCAGNSPEGKNECKGKSGCATE